MFIGFSKYVAFVIGVVGKVQVQLGQKLGSDFVRKFRPRSTLFCVRAAFLCLIGHQCSLVSFHPASAAKRMLCSWKTSGQAAQFLCQGFYSWLWQCVSLDPLQTTVTSKGTGAKACPAQAIEPGKAEAEFSAAALRVGIDYLGSISGIRGLSSVLLRSFETPWHAWFLELHL